MHRGWLLAEEVPGAVVSSSSLRNLVVRPGFDRMNEVGKLDGILNEEYGDVVSDKI
jgi:hypothetical protein